MPLSFAIEVKIGISSNECTLLYECEMGVGWDEVNKEKWRTEIEGFWKLKNKWEGEMVGGMEDERGGGD